MCKMILLLFLCGLLGLCRGFGQALGPGIGGGGFDAANTKAILMFESPIYTCSDPLSMAFADTSGLEVVSHNETTSIVSGVLKFLVELPPSQFRIEVVGKKEVSGKFEVVFTKVICDLCNDLHEGSEYWKYIKKVGFPNECPFPPTDYIIENFSPEKEDMPVKGEFARFQCIVHLYDNRGGDCDNHDKKIFLGCFQFDFTIE